MGATYTRQSSSTIVDGATIEASHFNDEFDQLVTAFAADTGHTHDGTSAEGGDVTKLLGTAITIGDGTAGTDIVVTFDGETSDGVLTWMEDEDHFKFSDDVVMDSTKRLYLNDEGGEYIYGDGTDLYLVSGADINIPADIGLTFGNDGEKIEGDGTDLTIAGNNINLTATADVNIPSGVGITFATAEKIESDGTDLSITVGSGGDINIPADIGMTFGNDGEKIEGDGTDLTISASALFNVDAGTDIVLDAGGGDIFFKDDGTTFGSATNTSGNLIIKSGTTTALTFSGANVTGAGTYTGGGTMTTGGNIVIPDAGNIGSASDTDAIAISSGGVVTFSQNPVFPDGGVPIADLDIDGGTDIGEAIVDADLFIIDNGAGGTNRKTTASRLKTYIGSSSDPASADGDSLGTASLEWSDLYLADGGVIYFGNDQEITLTHAADDGLILKHVGTGDGKEPSLTFQAGDNDIAVNDVLGSIFFQAPDETAGTDAVLVAAGIEAVSEGNFAADNNATKLSFKTAASEAASEKMSLSSAGLLTVADDIVFKDGGTIGVTSATDAMTVSSGGIVTFKDDIVIKDGGTIGVGSAATAMTISSGGIVTFVDDIVIKDGGTIGVSSAATAMTISSGGIVTFVDDIVIKDGGTIGSASAAGAMTISSGGIVTFVDDILIKDGGTIGSASDADSIAIASDGVVTFSQAPVFPDGSINIADLDIDGGTDIGEAIVDADLFIIDNGAGGTNRKVAASRIKTYAGFTAATQAEMESASDNTVGATPGRVNFSPHAVKCAAGWEMGAVGTTTLAVNLASVTDTGTGDNLAVWDDDFSGTDYIAVGTIHAGSASRVCNVDARAAGNCRFTSRNESGTLADSTLFYVMAMGDQ